MATNTERLTCIVCKECITKKQTTINCKICLSVIHFTCAGIPEDTVTALENGSLSFKCLFCNNDSSLENLLRIEFCTLNEKIDAVVHRMDSELNSIKKDMYDMNKFMKEFKKDNILKVHDIKPEPLQRDLVKTKRLQTEDLSKAERNPRHNHSKELQITEFSDELSFTLRSRENFQQIKNYLTYITELTKCVFKDKRFNTKESFIYILMDSGISDNLPSQAENLEDFEIWKQFLQSIFYVGKGKSSRPYEHLKDAKKALKEHHANLETKKLASNLSLDEALKNIHSVDDPKFDRILNIWREGNGIVCLHVFHNIHNNDAYTREAAIIDAIGRTKLTNCIPGTYYSDVINWSTQKKKHLGIALLFKAMHVYLNDIESPIFLDDL